MLIRLLAMTFESASISAAGRFGSVRPVTGTESTPHVASFPIVLHDLEQLPAGAVFACNPFVVKLLTNPFESSVGREWPPSRWSRFNRNDTVTFLNPWRAGDSLAASHVASLCHVDSTAEGSWKLLILGVK